MKTLIVISESSRARIFLQEERGVALKEIEDLEHAGSRAHSRDLGSDQPGRSFDSSGTARHAMGKEEEPKHQEALHFARQIADRLEQARTSGECAAIVLAAPPEFLGNLRQQISGQTVKLVVKEISKNLVHKTSDEILEYISAP